MSIIIYYLASLFNDMPFLNINYSVIYYTILMYTIIILFVLYFNYMW
jgi:hypothetical protein